MAVLDTGITPGPGLQCRRFVTEYDATTRTEGPVEDATGHGTHIAGTIAQCSENGIRTAGVAPDVDLIDVKVLDESPGAGGTGRSGDVADGIVFAARNGADVINLSVSSPCDTTYENGCRFVDIDAAIDTAASLGITILAAGGNDGGSGFVPYPANHPDVIAVGSIDASMQLPPYASFGSALDHVAPGGVDTDTDGDGIIDAVYQEWYDADRDSHRTLGLFGSSQAVAHSSGIAALLLSADPSLGPDGPRALLNDTACDLFTRGGDDRAGAGLVRAADALEAAVATATARPSN